MVTERRKGKSPYEIMADQTDRPDGDALSDGETAGDEKAGTDAGSGAGGGLGLPDPNEKTVDMAAPQYQAPTNPFIRQRTRSARPIVLRIPPGHAVVLVGVLLGAIVLGYLVGWYRGEASGAARVEQKYEVQFQSRDDTLRKFGSSPPVAVPSSDNTSANRQLSPQPGAVSPAPGQDTSASTGGDPRKIGLNYWVLSRLPADEAKRACAFLRDNGVDSFANPIDNQGLCEVIALPGFTGRTEKARQLETYLKRLGRIWRSEHGGPEAFVTMYLRKHKGS